MLRLTLELVPHGDETRHRTLGELYIWNLGHTDADLDLFSYGVATHWHTFPVGGVDVSKGEVKGHDRLKEPVWALVRKALDACGFNGPDRN